MSSVVISGDTSGSVTLQAPSVAGTTVLTLPATSGTVIVGTSGVTSVASGGTGRTTNVAYSVVCGGTTTGGVEQSVASVGTSGQVLTSGGAGALPTWTTISTTPPTTLYDIGTYVIARPTNSTSYATNATIAGSSLYSSSSAAYYHSSEIPSFGFYNPYAGATVVTGNDNVGTGTWRCMSRAYGNGGTVGAQGLWVRIS